MAQDWDRKTLNLKPGQFSRLQQLYPEHGASAIIRLLIDAHLRRIETETQSPKLEVNIDVGH